MHIKIYMCNMYKISNVNEIVIVVVILWHCYCDVAENCVKQLLVSDFYLTIVRPLNVKLLEFSFRWLHITVRSFILAVGKHAIISHNKSINYHLCLLVSLKMNCDNSATTASIY